jgi:hypothetical protein
MNETKWRRGEKTQLPLIIQVIQKNQTVSSTACRRKIAKQNFGAQKLMFFCLSEKSKV